MKKASCTNRHFYTRYRWMMWTSVMCLVFLLSVALPWPSSAYAAEDPLPYVEIIQINAQQFPEIAITVAAGNLEGTLAQLTPTVRENGEAQVIVADETQTLGTEIAFVINTEQFDQRDALGGTDYDNMIYVLLSLVQREFLVRQQDRLAAYAISETSGLDLIQDWTDEPNLLFNQLAQHTPDAVTAERPVTDGLWQALAQFPEDRAIPVTRSIVLFSVDTNLVPTETVSIEALIVKANERNVHIHIVELIPTEQTTDTATLLEQLATETEGLYLPLQSSTQIDALGARLLEQRQQRTLTYQSNAPYLEQIAVAFELADGTEVAESRHLARLALPTANAHPLIGASASSAAAEPSSAQSTAAVGDEQSAATLNLISIPGTSLAVPLRTIFIIVGLLVMLLAYLIVEEIGQHRLRAAHALAKFESDDAAYPLLGAESNGAMDRRSDSHRRSILPVRRNGFQNGATPISTDDTDDDGAYGDALIEEAFEDDWLALPSYARTENGHGHLSAADDHGFDTVEEQSFDADDRTMGTITYI